MPTRGDNHRHHRSLLAKRTFEFGPPRNPLDNCWFEPQCKLHHALPVQLRLVRDPGIFDQVRVAARLAQP